MIMQENIHATIQNSFRKLAETVGGDNLQGMSRPKWRITLSRKKNIVDAGLTSRTMIMFIEVGRWILRWNFQSLMVE